jgi:hypothetical protein
MKGPTGTSISRRVEGSRIFVGEKPYAEIVLIGKSDTRDSYRGIAIHYILEGRYEWISPKKGWALKKDNQTISDIETLQQIWIGEPRHDGEYTILKGSKRIHYKEYYGVEWRWDVKISDDGLYVTYVGNNFFFGQRTEKYRIKQVLI